MQKQLVISILLLFFSSMAAEAQIPNVHRIFDRNQTHIILMSDNKGMPIYSFVTNEDFESLKNAFLKALGDDWKEIERFDAGHNTGVTGKERKDKEALVGDLRLASPKHPKKHLILAVFKAPNTKYKTKYSMMILVDEAPPKVEEPPKKD